MSLLSAYMFFPISLKVRGLVELGIDSPLEKVMLELNQGENILDQYRLTYI